MSETGLYVNYDFRAVRDYLKVDVKQFDERMLNKPLFQRTCNTCMIIIFWQISEFPLVGLDNGDVLIMSDPRACSLVCGPRKMLMIFFSDHNGDDPEASTVCMVDFAPPA
jgi:hypothetical protein